MSDFLKIMASASSDRAALINTSFSSADFDMPLVSLTFSDFDLIAEIKEHSPAEGDLSNKNIDRISRAKAYSDGGAIAISVLTEPSRFGGDLSHMTQVVNAVPNTPVMRKDFLVEPIQILEARKAGASGILLVTTMLGDAKLREMLACAWDCGLFVLLESFSEEDLKRSSDLLKNNANRDRLESGQFLMGINSRNLRTLEVNFERFRNLSNLLPAGKCVAESGLNVSEDFSKVSSWGYNMALVGSSLMRSADPASMISKMKIAGAKA
ncbi:MAG: indole-3-glycerol phosphate synthase [Gammaproteobacteria bacterium]|nr:indole-3-glycerol phosphate synthase [Gammaproteobacteria bacterium]|tara:strand:+ start:268 stop:1068 length:801 start_codon:yes stop_codon:yes gene_type:complete